MALLGLNILSKVSEPGVDRGGTSCTHLHLLGVMRFLQLEWHNHERARNAWDIERAEMKAKIAKQEGEVRSAKKLNDQLNRHIRMLEQALTKERAKAKSATGESVQEEGKDAKGKGASRPEKTGMTFEMEHWTIRLLTLVICRTEQATQLFPRYRT
jgi:uncharacterized protein YlxW (UPF0749 family)